MILPFLMKKRKPNKYQKIIRKFLKEPDAIYKNVGLIKREMSIAKKLFLKIEEEKFWEEAFLSFKLNSLAWLLSQDGIDYLNQEAKRQKFKLIKPVVYDVADDKFGKDVKVIKQNKTRMDFLKNAT